MPSFSAALARFAFAAICDGAGTCAVGLRNNRNNNASLPQAGD